MKNLCLLLIVFLIIGCDNDVINSEYTEIKIEKHYPYIYDTKTASDLDENTLELFNLNIYSINSINELNDSPLLEYCTEDLKEELSKFDFQNYTLFVTGSYEQYELLNLESNFGFNNFSSTYVYKQNLLCKAAVDPLDNICLILDVFSVKKISNDFKLSFEKKIGFTES